MKHIHLIGIGGTGLSAIARVLLEKGYTVSGSDRTASPLFNAITDAGAHTFLGHAPEQIAGAELVIRSSAVPDYNPEVVAALAKGIPVLKRAEFLEELINDQETLAIAGSHGKTTTTAMLAWVLEKLGNDPSYIVGSVVKQLGCNAHAGKGTYFVIEADEYDYMFLGLSPLVAVVTNIEHDHPDCFPTMQSYRDAFKQFLSQVKPGGLGLLCWDDPAAQLLIKEMKASGLNVLSYGTSDSADYYAKLIPTKGSMPTFDLVFSHDQKESQKIGRVTLKIPGEHNVLNAAAVLAVVHYLGLSLPNAIEALNVFTGASRRFDVLGSTAGVTIIDDYGHHPTEISETLKAAKSAYPGQRIWAVWQPHTFTRTKTLEEDFIKALSLADRAIVLKIFAARENDAGYTAETIANAVPNHKATYIEDFDQITKYLLKDLSNGDVAIFFSAGDATKISKAVLENLRDRTVSGGNSD